MSKSPESQPRTILHAILDASRCADDELTSPTLSGVCIEWADAPILDATQTVRVLRAVATDGKVLVALHCAPPDGWPDHPPLVISCDSIARLRDLLRRNRLKSGQIAFHRIVARLETVEGKTARTVLAIELPDRDEVVKLSMVPMEYPKWRGAVSAQAIRTGYGPHRYCDSRRMLAASDALGWGKWQVSPVFHGDRGIFLFGKVHQSDFALVMPLVVTAEVRYPFGKPTDVAAAT